MPASATLRLTGSAALGHIGFVVQESWEGGVQEAEVDTRKAGRCSGPGWGVSRRQREERGTKLRSPQDILRNVAEKQQSEVSSEEKQE